jgi:hypothetical protein
MIAVMEQTLTAYKQIGLVLRFGITLFKTSIVWIILYI